MNFKYFVGVILVMTAFNGISADEGRNALDGINDFINGLMNTINAQFNKIEWGELDDKILNSNFVTKGLSNLPSLFLIDNHLPNIIYKYCITSPTVLSTSVYRLHQCLKTIGSEQLYCIFVRQLFARKIRLYRIVLFEQFEQLPIVGQSNNKIVRYFKHWSTIFISNSRSIGLAMLLEWFFIFYRSSRRAKPCTKKV